MSKFSPGPWTIADDTPRASYVNGADGYQVAEVDSFDDARLIACAPEMHELLDKLAAHECRWSNSDDWCQEIIPRLHALLKRLDGE